MPVPSSVSVGSLAFVGPTHVPDLSEYSYVRVRSLKDDMAVVAVVGPEDHAEGTHEVALATLRNRLVDDDETELWPGSYVSMPVAFVQPRGRSAGLWSYGVVSSYRMTSQGPILDIIDEDDLVAFPLGDDDRVIRLDNLNYALQVDKGMSVATVNPQELLTKLNTIVVDCAQPQARLPDSVTALLTRPISASELVTLIRPHNLERVQVRRQHIIDISLQSSKKRAGTVFDDPDKSSSSANKREGSRRRSVTIVRHAGSSPDDHDDASSSDTNSNHDDDVANVQQQNRRLGKRLRRSSSSSASSESFSLADDRPRQSRGVFQPSAVQRHAHSLVVNSKLQGKDAHSLLEYVQRSDAALFHATPPVLRGSYEFGFGDRGLELMHFKRASMADKKAASSKGVNMTDFSERNLLRAASQPACRSDVSDALRVLAVFAHHFYNKHVNQLIAAAAVFVDSYTGIDAHDAAGWSDVAYWISHKFGKFCSLMVCGASPSALAVAGEFSRLDDSLAQLNDHRTATRAPPSAAARRSPRNSYRGTNHQHRTSSLPQSVIDGLPRKEGRRACLKFLSKDGCTGNGSGGCFDPRRAHFLPKTGELHADAKAIIVSRYHGLSTAASDL